MRKLLREPLVHFLIVGAVLFLIFDLTREPDQAGTRRIVVTAGQLEQLAAQFSRTWMRPPTEQELEGLVERHIRSEVFYREALGMGLGQDDPYVRNRLALKLELVLDDLSAEAAPSDEELERFLTQHAERFVEPARLSFRQVLLNPDRHPDPDAEAERLLAELRAGSDPASLGDATLLGHAFDDSSRDEVARQLGANFADALAELAPGAWSGPIRSPFGMHLVLVTERQPERRPALAEVRDAVLGEWRDQRRRERKEQAYRRLRERYEIVMEPGAQVDQARGSRSSSRPAAAPTGQGDGAAARGGPVPESAERIP